MIRRPPRSTLDRSSAASDVYKRQPRPVGCKGWLGSARASAWHSTLEALGRWRLLTRRLDIRPLQAALHTEVLGVGAAHPSHRDQLALRDALRVLALRAQQADRLARRLQPGRQYKEDDVLLGRAGRLAERELAESAMNWLCRGELHKETGRRVLAGRSGRGVSLGEPAARRLFAEGGIEPLTFGRDGSGLSAGSDLS